MEDGASIFCARCNGYGDFEFLPESLETMCTECGLFLECHVSIEISEDNIELCRVGSPYSPRDEVLYTAISKNPDGKKGKFGWVGNQCSTTECNLIEAFETITTMADRLHLDADVKNGAYGLYKKLDDHQSVKGRTGDAIIASCLYIACQLKFLPRTVQEICTAGERATEEEIDREKKFVTKRLITIQSINLLRRFCCSLGMSEQAIKAAEEAAMKCEKLDIRSRSPVTIAAGIIYMIAQLSKEELLLEDISDAIGIADDTILDSFKVLNPHAPKIIPPSYSDKDGLTCLRKPLKFEEMSTNNMVRGILIPTRLPNDIINEIIMHLPAISNFRFKCVSKQWFSLNFEALKLKSQTHTAFGIFYGTYKGVRDARAKYVKTEMDQNYDSCIDGTLSFLPEHRYMTIHDSSSGLLLCECITGGFYLTSHLYVSNPALRKWVEIPNISMATVRLAILDFNPLVSVHFKVIIIMRNFQVSRKLKVFSSEMGEWSESHVAYPLPHQSTSSLTPVLFYDGLIFVKGAKGIGGFDLEGKWCSRTEYPGKPSDFFTGLYHSGGCLHYYCYGPYSSSEDCEVYVWKLESGSWLLKICFSVPFPMRYIESIKFHPIKDDVIFLQINDRLYSYNIKTTQAIKLCSFTSAGNYCLYSPFYLDFSGYWWKKMNG